MEDSFLADCTYPVSPPAALPGATTIQTFSPNSLLHLTSPRINRETFLVRSVESLRLSLHF